MDSLPNERITSMKFKEIKTIKSILKARIGLVWPLILFKALFRKNAIFNKTRWSKTSELESEFIKRISPAPALYVTLFERFGKEKAFDVYYSGNFPRIINWNKVEELRENIIDHFN